jgi:predicted nucleic acid-binding protein
MSILVDALRITERYRFSLWDSLIIAAAIAAGCDRLMSEDMSHGQTIEGLAIVNPFVGE